MSLPVDNGGGDHDGVDIHTVAHGGPDSEAGGLFSIGTVAHRQSTLEKGKSAKRKEC